MDIGKRIKQLRIAKNLTLEELAVRSELTKGFLSQLERNLTSPSIQTLEDITEILGVSLETFFKEEKDEKFVFTDDDYFILDQEKSHTTWLVPSAQTNEMEPILLTLEEGGESNEIKPHEGEEFGYCIQGKLSIINLDKDEKTIIKKGETFYLKGNYTHKIINESEHQGKLIWVCTPPIF